MIRKLGRLPRAFNPKIPHMSAMLAALDLPAPPQTVDWTNDVTNFSMMLNDQLGDCTCAAVYHARQIWTMNTLTEDTQPDNSVLQLYEAVGHYVPGDESTDNGAVEQDVLTYLLNTGAPLANGETDKILAFVEVDPRNIDDVKRTINDCGLAYIGFDVPSNIMSGGEPPELWTVDFLSQIEGGHAVILPGYDEEGPFVISWGAKYKMTWDFFSTYTEEVYAIASNDWVKNTGRTPLNMSIADLENLMSGIKEK